MPRDNDSFAVASERLDIEAMAEVLAEWVATGSDVTDGDRQRAREALDAIGIPVLIATLDMAERIILFGTGFHAVAGFFADGTAEQAYLRRLASSGRE